MARKLVTLSSEFPYHVTARCINREWFGIPMDDVWSLMEDHLFITQKIYSLSVQMFVLMPNHFHLVLSTPEANISRAMQFFMGKTSKEISRLSGRINQTYGTRHHKTLITRNHYLLNVFKYVYRNPVKAGLSDSVEEYPHSTLHGLLGKTKLVIPLIEDTILFPEVDGILRWLNTTPSDAHLDEIRRALRKPIFALSQNHNQKKPSELEHLLL
jgi:putative transposase